MASIIFAMPKREDALRLSDIIRGNGLLDDIDIVRTGNDVLRLCQDKDYGVIICTKRLPDMDYLELFEYLPKYFGLIILTNDSGLETTDSRMIKLLMPFKHRDFISTIELLTSAFYKDIKKEKKGNPKRSEKEQKVIDEAKQILMNVNGMSEPEAFRYIQKRSMDLGRSLVESAQMIIMLNAD